jgi:hypothetical protein
MILSSTAPQIDVGSAESFSRPAPMELLAHHKPVPIARPEFRYRRSLLPIEGGKLLLRLTQFPSIAVNPETLECEVRGWGVKMPTKSVENLPYAMARRFLELFSGADRGTLEGSDEENWSHILDQVDFAAFSVDRAAPHYIEGTLIRTRPICLVEWHDGTRQKINPDAANSLGLVAPGDQFGAFVKLGRDNEVQSIERVTFLPTIE